MNIVFKLLEKFFHDEFSQISILILLTFFINFIQIKWISTSFAEIITSIQKNSIDNSLLKLRGFIFVSLFFLVVYFIFKIVQNNILSKLHQWIKFELVKVLLLSNNEDYKEENYMKMNIPINRISFTAFMIFNEIITFILPAVVLFVVILVYFSIFSLKIGGVFLICNTILILYIYFVWPYMLKMDEKYERDVKNTEFYLLEILNNMDKIIFRGQTDQEINVFHELINQTIDHEKIFYYFAHKYGFFMNLIVYITIFVIIYLLIQLFYQRNISSISFIVLLSILMTYKDKIGTFIQQIPDFVEFIGRTNGVIEQFKDFNDDYKLNNYLDHTLYFNEIRFEHVFFSYKNNKVIFDDLTLNINTNSHEIIGIIGESGRGKSTLMKLLLKMFKNYTGDIFIDDINIKDIDANYIRKNVVYVNQSGKLFDKVVIENILYGCSDTDSCNSELKKILDTYPLISAYFKNIDINKKQSGSLGENLSGGQRQIVNIIGGLIHKSPILILDEPTNALDSELKHELLNIIYDYKKHKKCIFIITHDKDVFRVFDKQIQL